MYNNRDSIDFGSAPVGVLFRSMFLPTLVGMVSMVALNVTDGAFVGRGVGSDALAAVNIVAPIFLITSGIGLMMGIGSSVAASIHLSQDNLKAARINMTQALAASATIGCLLAVLFYNCQEPLCMLFGCSVELLPLACSYMKWISLLTPFSMVGIVAMFMVRLDGSPRVAMAINCMAAGLNILLDYIFIFPMRMGLEGAGIATTISFSIAIIPIGIYFLRFAKSLKLYRLKMSLTSARLTFRNIAYHVRIGASALLGEVAIAAVIVVGNYVFMQYLGPDGVAAYSVGCYCLPVVFMMGNAIVQSVQPIASFAYGQGDKIRFASSARVAYVTAGASGIMSMIIMMLGAGAISSMFLDDQCGAYTLCVDGLPYFSLSFLFISFNIVAVGLMQSAERAVAATIYTLMRGFILSIPCFIFMPMWFDSVGLWLALPIAEAITTLIIVLRRDLSCDISHVNIS